MKQFLKKINRGIGLSVVIVIGIIIYLLVVAAVQAQEKPEIESLVSRYVAAEIKYSMLPVEQRQSDKPMTEAELSTYLDEMADEVIPFYLDNERIRDMAYERMANYLISQTEGYTPVVLEYEKNILSFESFVYDGSRVTVSFKTQSVIERPEDAISGMSGGRIVGEVEDRMILEKVDGTWKVIYAGLSEPFDSHYRYAATARRY